MIITNQAKLAKKIKHLTTTAKLKHKWEYVHDKSDIIFVCQV